jgi:hypothetical protein
MSNKELLDKKLVDEFCMALDNWLSAFEDAEWMPDEEYQRLRQEKWREYRAAVRILIYKARRYDSGNK